MTRIDPQRTPLKVWERNALLTYRQSRAHASVRAEDWFALALQTRRAHACLPAAIQRSAASAAKRRAAVTHVKPLPASPQIENRLVALFSE